MDFVPDGWLKELMEDVQSFDFSRRSMFAGSLDALIEHVKTVGTQNLFKGEVTVNIESMFHANTVHVNYHLYLNSFFFEY